MMKKIIATSALIATTLLAVPAWAADHQVQMLNKDSEGRPMQFEPAFLKIAPGDTVTFVATDKGHNSESILNMIPEGGETWKGKINEEITVTFTQEGFYAYKCQPHVGLGMVGLIQVGDNPPALATEEVEKLPGRSKDRMAELIAEAEAGGGAEAGAAEGGDAEAAPAAQ
ncbi:pseudoazurin [Devosia albogilva]|uniref:Pseudoazurin n=1 Tax=Devosia albogilva TaxID=429726 RepID=A0ABW5QIY4_9HYPH